MSAKKLPNTWSLTGSLVLSAVVYACLGASAVVLKAKGGHKWVGSANTLTTVLAVIGALFTPLSRYLLAQCQSANLQRLAHQSLTGSVKIANLHKYDVASKGSFVDCQMAKWLARPGVPLGIPSHCHRYICYVKEGIHARGPTCPDNDHWCRRIVCGPGEHYQPCQRNGIRRCHHVQYHYQHR